MSLISIMSKEEMLMGPEYYWFYHDAKSAPDQILNVTMSALYACKDLYVDDLSKRDSLHHELVKLAQRAVDYFNLNLHLSLKGLEVFLVTALRTVFTVQYGLRPVRILEGKEPSVVKSEAKKITIKRRNNPWEEALSNLQFKAS